MRSETPDEIGVSSEETNETQTPEPPTPGLRGHRLIWLVAAVAVFSLGAGIGVSQFVISPSQAAANAAPPEPGLITVPVERESLSNDVTLRADATFDDAVDVTIETGEIGGPAVVTGQVPAVGTEIGPANVVLEIAGRPVISLLGELPAYRSLRAGVSGPDVAQLKEALRAVGIDPGSGRPDVYDAATAAAVDRLYAAVGYPAPSAGEEAKSGLSGAQEAVRSAQDGLDAAYAALQAASAGPSDVERLQADNTVRAAERAVAEAQTTGGDVAGAQDALALAQAERGALDAPRDTAAESAAVDSARRSLQEAKEAFAEAQSAALTPLPASEVLYLSSMPRRVDSVNVKRGDTLSGAAMSASGATLVLEGSVSEADAKLLAAGAAATFTLPDDTEATATVTSVEPKKAGAGEEDSSGSGRFTVTLAPGELTAEQIGALQGQNVRVSVPVSSTEGEVLAVPLAALTAGPGGESRVEVLRDGQEDTELVTVEPGLAAGGFVEVAATDGDLAVGDRVVVGE